MQPDESPPAERFNSSPETLVESEGWLSEDVWAILLGLGMLLAALVVAWTWGVELHGWLGKPGGWTESPLESLTEGVWGPPWKSSLLAWGLIAVAALPALLTLSTTKTWSTLARLAGGLVVVGLLATLAQVMAGQAVVKQYGFEYVIWALLLGLLISNTVGTPQWMRGAVRGEMYIKWGLVLLGAEVLFGKLLALGIPGVMVSWVVTPIVLVTTFIFGYRFLKIRSPSLVIVISADMSVCGVSAAIATAAACRAKREELSIAIGLSMAFTAFMMVAMPMAMRFGEVDDIVGGAWIGGTIDSTGAVTAAGAALGERAEKVATTVKMIQNILIGAIAFAVSVYWAARQRTDTSPEALAEAALVTDDRTGGFFAEVWRRFPKFVLGFAAASIITTLLTLSGPSHAEIVGVATGQFTKVLRGWLFCLAFVCIGLETNFRALLPALSGGKTLLLYVCGQSLNILLTGLMAMLVFGWLFRDAIQWWLAP